MLLKNHIANRLLTDESLWTEMCVEQMYKDKADLNEPVEILAGKYRGVYQLLSNDRNKTYYITNSVIDKLELFDVKKALQIEGWKVFETLPDFKKTFILPDGNKCIRVMKSNGVLHFCHIEMTMLPKEQRTPTVDGNLYWVLLFIDFEKERMAEHWLSHDGQGIAPFLYALLCFVELTDNETIVVEPGKKYGTRKQGKLINTLPTPVVIVNNTWNITTIRSEGFPVSGHVALRWAGPEGAKYAKMVYIEPYMKSGYTRRAGKELHKQ